MQEKVSIITVCMNSETTIKRCLRSVKSQTYKNIEHIIVDGNSTDKTLQIISEEAIENRDVTSEPDTGIYNALNKGLERATGDIVCVLHSDDEFFSENTIEIIVKKFRDQPELNLISGHVRLFNGDTLIRYYGRIELSIENIRKGLIPAHTGLFLSTSKKLSAQYYDESFASAGDFEYLTRLQKEKPYVYYSDEVITDMQIGGESTSGLKSYIRSTIEIQRALKENNIKFNSVLIWLRLLWKLKQFWRK